MSTLFFTVVEHSGPVCRQNRRMRYKWMARTMATKSRKRRKNIQLLCCLLLTVLRSAPIGSQFLFAPGAVQVFIAQHQRAAALRRAFLRDPERPRVTEVQAAGGRWGQTAAIRFCFHPRIVANFREYLIRDKYASVADGIRCRTKNQNGSFGFAFNHSARPGRGKESRRWILAQVSDVAPGRGAPG